MHVCLAAMIKALLVCRLDDMKKPCSYAQYNISLMYIETIMPPKYTMLIFASTNSLRAASQSFYLLSSPYLSHKLLYCPSVVISSTPAI